MRHFVVLFAACSVACATSEDAAQRPGSGTSPSPGTGGAPPDGAAPDHVGQAGGASPSPDAAAKDGASDASVLDAGPPLPSACSASACTACTANWTSKIRDLDPKAVGVTISTYGDNIAKSTEQAAALRALDARLYRVPIRWNAGSPVSSAGGGPADIPADQYIDAITAMGASSIIVIGGATGDNDITPADAAALVGHYVKKGVTQYLVGNEPNNGGTTIDAYATAFNAIADAIRTVAPNVKIGGPTWSWFDKTALDKFMDLSGSRADIIDYHHYAMGNPPALADDAALAATSDWGTEIESLYQSLAANNLPGRFVTVGEYNWAWQYNDGVAGGDTRFYQPITTVWAASLLGHGLSAGGWLVQYSDQNGPLGITIEPGNATLGRASHSPMPIYHALGMWTGEGLFRRYGNAMFTTSCDDASVEAYATEGANLVVVNKKAAKQPALLTLEGLSQKGVSIWQTGTDPFAAPTKVAEGRIDPNGQLALDLPAMTVSTLVFGD
jgi:hypothetical protein